MAVNVLHNFQVDHKCAAYVGAAAPSVRKPCPNQAMPEGRYCDDHKHLERHEN